MGVGEKPELRPSVIITVTKKTESKQQENRFNACLNKPQPQQAMKEVRVKEFSNSKNLTHLGFRHWKIERGMTFTFIAPFYFISMWRARKSNPSYDSPGTILILSHILGLIMPSSKKEPEREAKDWGYKPCMYRIPVQSLASQGAEVWAIKRHSLCWKMPFFHRRLLDMIYWVLYRSEQLWQSRHHPHLSDHVGCFFLPGSHLSLPGT